MTVDASGRRREDVRQFLWFCVGYGAALLLGYLLLRKVNLLLSVEEMGRYSYAMSLVGLTAAVFYQAAPQAYVRFNDNHAVSPLLRRRLVPVFAASSFAVAIAVWTVTREWYAMLYAAIPFFFERMSVLRSQMRIGAVNMLKVSELAVPFLALSALSLLPSSAAFAPSAALVLAVYGLGYATCFLFPMRLRECDCPSAGKLSAFLVPVTCTMAVATAIDNLTVVATKSLAGYEAAAQIGVAVRNLMFARALFSLFQMFYPVVYFREMKRCNYGTVRIYRVFIVAVAAAFVLCTVVFSPLLYEITGAGAYIASRRAFAMLSVAALLDFVFDVFALYFQHEIKTWKATLTKSAFLVAMVAGIVCVRKSATVDMMALLVLLSSAASSIPGTLWAAIAERKLRHERSCRTAQA